MKASFNEWTSMYRPGDKLQVDVYGDRLRIEMRYGTKKIINITSVKLIFQYSYSVNWRHIVADRIKKCRKILRPHLL